MVTVCEICGDAGYDYLLVSCADCKGAAVHQYCLAEVVFDGSLVVWSCYECLSRHGEVEVSNQMQQSHASTVVQPSTNSGESTREARPRRNRKNKSYKYKSRSSSRKKSLPRKHTQKKSNMRPMGNKANRRGHNATNIASASGKVIHSCETIKMETAEASNDETKQVVNEHSVHELNNDHVEDRLPPRVKQINLQLDGSESPSNTAEQSNLPKEHGGSFWSLQDTETRGDGNGNVTDDFTLKRNKKKVRFQLDNEASIELRQRSMAASVPQPYTLNKNAVDRTMPSSANMDVLPRKSNLLPSEHTELENPKGSCEKPVLTGGNQSNPSRLLDRAYSNSSLETTSKANIVLEASALEVELSGAVQHLVKNNSRKRRLLLLPDDDDDEEEAVDVQPKVSNPRSLGRDCSMNKHIVDTEDCVEVAIQNGNLNGQNLKNGMPVKKQKCVEDGEYAVQLDSLIPESCEFTPPVKKRRRYIVANEDEEDEEVIIGEENAKCAPDVAKLASQTVVANDHLQSRMAFNSESANQQCYIYSQPIDEPVWSGIFTITNEVFVTLAAHLSTKACPRVWELSRSLQPVVEVIKLPLLGAWPKSWKASGPTDDSIGLYFFPHSMSSNEESDRFVEDVIESDAVLKVVVGIAELLIFPSTLLPEQYHVFHGKHYLWGVFKRMEDRSDKGVLVEEQDGSACGAEEGKVQEHPFLDQQYEVQREPSDNETFVVKHVVHVENQLPVERNREAQEEAMKASMTEPSSSSPSVKPNPPKAGSNCFMQPRIGCKLHAPEGDHQEDENVAKPSGDPVPAAVTPKLMNSAEYGHGQPRTAVVPPASTLFGFVAARTPRSQQLLQEMASEGVLLFSVPEEMVTTGSRIGNNIGVESHLTPDNGYPPMQERRQPIEFVSMDHDDAAVASEACLELFPVRQEHIGWAPRVEVGKEVDLDLSLKARSRSSSALL